MNSARLLCLETKLSNKIRANSTDGINDESTLMDTNFFVGGRYLLDWCKFCVNWWFDVAGRRRLGVRRVICGLFASAFSRV